MSTNEISTQLVQFYDIDIELLGKVKVFDSYYSYSVSSQSFLVNSGSYLVSTLDSYTYYAKVETVYELVQALLNSGRSFIQSISLLSQVVHYLYTICYSEHQWLNLHVSNQQ